jgi:glycosyltransferase involved in cell wall biosynthesis
MPVYNGASVIKDAIDSIVGQNYRNYELIIADDCSKDNIREVLRKCKNELVSYFRNKKNLGYGYNMEYLRTLIPGSTDIVFLMAQDDFLAKDTFKKINAIFNTYKEVGAIIRPFYMFTHDINKPIRDFEPYSDTKDTILSLKNGTKAYDAILRTVCQLSGLAFRKKLLTTPFHKDVMTSHIYPFLEIYKHHKIMFMKDYTIAVRTLTSQTRHVPKIYLDSPTQVWVNMIDSVFSEKKFKKINIACKKIVLSNGIVGFVQLKNFSTLKILFREYWIIIKNDPSFLFNLKYWFYLTITLFTPRQILLPLVDFYKEKILSLALKKRHLTFNKV